MSSTGRGRWDVVVVGAGLAGLACARDLTAAGSVQGALASGARAAREVAAGLAFR